MSRSALLARAALAGLALCAARVGAADRAHPQDGPHADVQINVERERVQIQLTVNLIFVDQVVPPNREDLNLLEGVEAEILRDDLANWFLATNPLVVDGAPAEATLVDWDAAPPDLERLPYYPRFGARAIITLRLGFEYRTTDPPRKVGLTWGEFPQNLAVAMPGSDPPPLDIRARVRGYGESQIYELTTLEPAFTWHAPPPEARARFEGVPAPPPPPARRAPLAVSAWAVGALLAAAAVTRFLLRAEPRRALLVGGAAAMLTAGVLFSSRPQAAELPTPEQAGEIFRKLHDNIYSALRFTAEDDIYDALAASVHGELLDELYDQLYQGLILQEEGGAVCDVEEVLPLETDVHAIGLLPPTGRPGFRVDASWRVKGAVYHFDHSHHRTNEYAARYTIVSEDAGWRIRASEVYEMQRIEAAPIPEGEF
jgi:hypothetical protein